MEKCPDCKSNMEYSGKPDDRFQYWKCSKCGTTIQLTIMHGVRITEKSKVSIK